MDEQDDQRRLTRIDPLIYSNVNPYGLIRLNMTERLAIERTEAMENTSSHVVR